MLRLIQFHVSAHQRLRRTLPMPDSGTVNDLDRSLERSGAAALQGVATADGSSPLLESAHLQLHDLIFKDDQP